MVRRPTGGRRLRNLQAHLSQTERIDKYVDHANRVALVNQVIEAFGRRSAPTICLFMKRLINSLKDSQGNRSSSPVFSLPGRVAEFSQ